jgi:hypothetical protein
MKTDFIKQYAHTWRVMAGVVKEFDPDAWLHAGRGVNTPARLSWHILQAAKNYMQDPSPLVFPSGRPSQGKPSEGMEEDLPTQADIAACIAALQESTVCWLSEIDYDCENSDFPWAGETKLGVVLFLLRHSLFHIGELSSILNESKNGDVEDIYVKVLA